MTPPQTLGWIGSRRLLRQLRDLMKGGGSVQDRLNRTVALIADDMVAEVCSFYLLRAGEVLELLRPKASVQRPSTGPACGSAKVSSGILPPMPVR